MNSFENLNFDDNTHNLQSFISCQNEDIKQLDTCDAVSNERDDLRKLSNEFEQWKIKHKNEQNRVFTELITVVEAQTEKLKQVTSTECKLQAKCSELQKTNEYLSNQIKIFKINEDTHKSSLKDLENKLKCSEKELCKVKSELEKKDCTIKNLKTSLKSNEEEFCEISIQLDECKKNNCQLNKVNATLETDLNCTKTKLDDLSLSTKCAEEKFKHKQEKMCHELKITQKKLNNLELQNNEANYKINSDECKIKKMTANLKELKVENTKKQNEMINLIQKLNDANRTQEDDLCNLKNKIKKVERENECNRVEINNQKKKINEKDCQIKQMQLLSENSCQTQPKCQNYCCLENKIETQPPNPCFTMPMVSLPSICNNNQSCNNKNACNIYTSRSIESIIQKYSPKTYNNFT